MILKEVNNLNEITVHTSDNHSIPSYINREHMRQDIEKLRDENFNRHRYWKTEEILPKDIQNKKVAFGDNFSRSRA